MADLLLHGRAPYVGAWDQNYPGVLIVHVIQLLIFGRSTVAMYALDAILNLVGYYFLFSLAKKIHSAKAGWLAVVFTSFYYVNEELRLAAERDIYVTILVIIAATVLFNKRGKEISGLLLGIALLFRPTNALYIVVFAIVVFWFTKREERLKVSIRFALFAALPMVLFLLIYLVFGYFEGFYTATVLFTTKVYNRMRPLAGYFEGFDFYYKFLLAAPIGIYTLYKAKQKEYLTLILGLVISGFLLLLLLYRWSYNYHLIITLLALLGSIGWCTLSEYIERYLPKVLKPLPIIVFFLLWVSFFFRGSKWKHGLEGYCSGEIGNLRELHQFFDPREYDGAGAHYKVLDYLKPKVKPGSLVQMCGQYTVIPYMLEALPASRFITPPSFMMRNSKGELQPFQLEWRKEYLRAIREKRPEYFIIPNAPYEAKVFLNGRVGMPMLKEDFTEMYDLLGEMYQLDTVINAFEIYKLKD